MAITIYGGTTIQPLEVNVSASQQQTTFVFLSNDSGSYIYSGSNPDFIISGSPLPHHTSSLTFEDSGSIFSFVFSGSGYGTPSPSLPGTTLSASINGLSSSADIAAVFTASVVAATNMTASIISSSIVVLTNSAYSSSAVTTSSFSPGTLGVYTTQVGHPSGYLSGSDTTGSLTVTGSLNVTGSVNINGSLTTTEGFGPGVVVVREASITIASADVLKLNITPIEIVAAPGAGYAIEVISASARVIYNSAAYATNTTIQVESNGATTSQFRLLNGINQTISSHRSLGRYVSANTETQIIENAALQVFVPSGNPTAGDSDITVYVTYRIIEL
jgi:hypothetical protein